MKLRPISDKRGVEISTNTVIVVIIALLVLVISAAFFAGGMAQLVGKIKEIFYRPSVASEDVVREQCRSLCETESASAYCRFLNIKIGNNIVSTNCNELIGRCTVIDSKPELKDRCDKEEAKKSST